MDIVVLEIDQILVVGMDIDIWETDITLLYFCHVVIKVVSTSFSGHHHDGPASHHGASR